jgi:F-type H+-transporting ATPase subunit gamma
LSSDLNERAEARLANLNNIEPLLGSLRVLALSSMQMALNRKANLNDYKTEYYRILSMILAALPKDDKKNQEKNEANEGRRMLVVLGSERGLCGIYNKNLASLAGTWLSKQEGPANILPFGVRLHEPLKQAGLNIKDQGSLTSGSKPHYAIARGLVTSWIEDFKQHRIRAIYVLSFRKPAVGFYKPLISQLIPLPMKIYDGLTQSIDWPPRIIEGDPKLIAENIVDHLTAIEFYDLILDSISAENAIRYNLLEEAKGNTLELIEELSLEIQIAKRQMITQQIQEMAAGAGLTR